MVSVKMLAFASNRKTGKASQTGLDNKENYQLMCETITGEGKCQVLFGEGSSSVSL